MAKVFVICGHGAGDPGACAGGCSEADLVRRLAARMKALGGADVQIGDASRNWYADNGIGRGHCPRGVPVVELHMDSASAAARGGHVVIKAGRGAGAADNALASFIGGFFPGRSKTIVGRSDLANVNRAAATGVDYRLVECGFISNADDREKFINHMDDLASGLLACFEIGDIVTNEDIEKIADLAAQKVWACTSGKETYDRVRRSTQILKIMCGMGADSVAEPKEREQDLHDWTIGRWQRCTAMLKALLGIAPGDMQSTEPTDDSPLALSDDDVERIADRVAEMIGGR